MDRASDSHRILEPELLMSARGAANCGSVNAVTADGIPTKALRAAKAAIEIMKVRMVSPLG
jgi:hypothetical protein